jgi:hypothetical protein
MNSWLNRNQLIQLELGQINGEKSENQARKQADSRRQERGMVKERAV